MVAITDRLQNVTCKQTLRSCRTYVHIWVFHRLSVVVYTCTEQCLPLNYRWRFHDKYLVSHRGFALNVKQNIHWYCEKIHWALLIIFELNTSLFYHQQGTCLVWFIIFTLTVAVRPISEVALVMFALTEEISRFVDAFRVFIASGFFCFTFVDIDAFAILQTIQQNQLLSS